MYVRYGDDGTVSFSHVFRFFKLFQEQEELFDILYGTILFAALRTNIRLRALSAVSLFRKMACVGEVEINCIFETQHRIVTTFAENILLKIRIIFIEKTWNR